MVRHLVRHDAPRHVLIDGELAVSAVNDLGPNVVILDFVITANDLAWSIRVTGLIYAHQGRPKDINVECWLIRSFNRLTLVNNLGSSGLRSTTSRLSNHKLVDNCRPTHAPILTGDVDQADVSGLAAHALSVCRQVRANVVGL